MVIKCYTSKTSTVWKTLQKMQVMLCELKKKQFLRNETLLKSSGSTSYWTKIWVGRS